MTTTVLSLIRLSAFAAVVCVLALEVASAETIEDIYRAPSYDYSWLTDDRYQLLLESRTVAITEADESVRAAETALSAVRTSLDAARNAVSQAWSRYLVASDSNDSDNLKEAWKAVGDALHGHATAREIVRTKVDVLKDERKTLTYKRFWRARLENDWRDAQAARGVAGAYTVAEDIASCRPGGGQICSGSELLRADTRFTVFQPALGIVGVHHAHAKGLTGAGVRVAIEDDAVNYRLPEFSGRVSFAGARIVYPRPLSTFAPFGTNEWSYISSSYEPTETEDPRIHETLTVDAIVRLERDWTEEIWLENQHEDVVDWDRWVVIPAVESEDGPSHGTRVASVAVGRDFGVAPGATLIPIFKDLSRSGQHEQNTWSRFLLNYISRASSSEREAWDSHLAKSVRADYGRYDVVNRSFGIGVFDGEAIQSTLYDGTNWWGDELRRLLPLTWRAYMQTDIHPDDRAVVVYATGNSLEEWGGLGADLPYHERHLRGHQLSVMAVNNDGTHAFYSNFCGPLPPDWDTARWGRHYCLAAPGTVNAASNRPNFAFQDTEGTSFAAPIVTGAIALLMEHFRGHLGNTEVAKRLVDTANNRGRYAQIEIYGAGLLDLQAALQPVGAIVTGTPSKKGNTLSTVFQVPPAMGFLGRRLAGRGVEVASLDTLGAPFWSSPDRFFRQTSNPSAIPEFADPEWAPHRGFTPRVSAGPVMNGFQMLGGASQIGLERAPRKGFRWGVLGDTSSWLGGRATGAFGERVQSVTTWVGRRTHVELNDTLTLTGSATLASGRVFLQSGGMLEVDPHVMSAWQVGLEHGRRGHGKWWQLSVSQPLRAESGKGRLTYLAGLKGGLPFYDKATVPLAPEGREFELALTHEAPMGRGRGVMETAQSWNAGHEPGQTQWQVGLAYKMEW